MRISLTISRVLNALKTLTLRALRHLLTGAKGEKQICKESKPLAAGLHSEGHSNARPTPAVPQVIRGFGFPPILKVSANYRHMIIVSMGSSC